MLFNRSCMVMPRLLKPREFSCALTLPSMVQPISR